MFLIVVWHSLLSSVAATDHCSCKTWTSGTGDYAYTTMAVFARYAAGLTLLGCILLGLPQDGACIEKNHGDSIVSSAQATTTTITINFSKNVDGYAVQWDTSGSSNTALITGTTLTLKNLAEGTKYSINFLKPEIPFTRYYMYTTPTSEYYLDFAFFHQHTKVGSFPSWPLVWGLGTVGRWVVPLSI